MRNCYTRRQTLGRKWIGIDITYLAIGLVKNRLQGAYPKLKVNEEGSPVDLSGAQALAAQDKYQFEWWALLQIGAQPVGGKKKGADKGIDGVIPILIGGTSKKPQYGRVNVSIKGGANIGVGMVRDLKGTLTQNNPIGVFLTLANPTGPMKDFAAKAGHFDSKVWGKKYPKIQILTVEEVLQGKQPDVPWGDVPFAKPATEQATADQKALL